MKKPKNLNEDYFYCPYCRDWITDIIHRPDHHLDPDTPDPIRSNLWEEHELDD